jgi:hypothetical protein
MPMGTAMLSPEREFQPRFKRSQHQHGIASDANPGDSVSLDLACFKSLDLACFKRESGIDVSPVIHV